MGCGFGLRESQWGHMGEHSYSMQGVMQHVYAELFLKPLKGLGGYKQRQRGSWQYMVCSIGHTSYGMKAF